MTFHTTLKHQKEQVAVYCRSTLHIYIYIRITWTGERIQFVCQDFIHTRHIRHHSRVIETKIDSWVLFHGTRHVWLAWARLQWKVPNVTYNCDAEIYPIVQKAYWRHDMSTGTCRAADCTHNVIDGLSASSHLHLLIIKTNHWERGGAMKSIK